MLPLSVREVCRKELLEILRDKRSLFVLILLPVFLYPVLLIGMGLITSAQLRKLQERTYTVWVDEGGAPHFLADVYERDARRMSDEPEEFASCTPDRVTDDDAAPRVEEGEPQEQPESLELDIGP